MASVLPFVIVRKTPLPPLFASNKIHIIGSAFLYTKGFPSERMSHGAAPRFPAISL